MKVSRRQFVQGGAAGLGLVVGCGRWPGLAARTSKVARIGWLGAGSQSTATSNIEAFRLGLRELGYVEGENLTIEYRFAEAETSRVSGLAA